jgi:hypothetical protein
MPQASVRPRRKAVDWQPLRLAPLPTGTIPFRAAVSMKPIHR